MKLNGEPEAILEHVRMIYPDVDVDAVIAYARQATQRGKQEIYTYQAACLFTLAKAYNWSGTNILEFGTYYGFSAAVLAQATPLAQIVTLNPTEWEQQAAAENLRRWKNVEVKLSTSQELLKGYNGPVLDLIFVDGDHKRIQEDLPWWNWLAPGGLMLFHDYSPEGSKRQCPPVWRALHEFAEQIGREPDVLIVDDGLAGMAGWYKEAGNDS